MKISINKDNRLIIDGEDVEGTVIPKLDQSIFDKHPVEIKNFKDCPYFYSNFPSEGKENKETVTYLKG